MVLTAVKHVHKFIVDRHDTGVCACGEMRQFMTGNTEKLKDKTYTVIHTGDPNYQDPVSTKVTNNIPENIPEKEKSMETALVETEKKGGSFREKHLFLESKKTDIIKDYQTLSWEQVMKNWELSDSGLRQVLKRWEVYKSKHPRNTTEDKPILPNETNIQTAPPKPTLMSKPELNAVVDKVITLAQADRIAFLEARIKKRDEYILTLQNLLIMEWRGYKS